MATNFTRREVAKLASTGASDVGIGARDINGYGDRFGLVCMDFKTQKRAPKLSAACFRENGAAQRGRVRGNETA